MKKLVISLASLFSLWGTATELDVSMINIISPERDSFSLIISNYEAYDIMCPKIRVQAVVTHDNFGDRSGSFEVTTNNLYIHSSSDKSLELGSRELEKIRKIYPSAQIDSLRISEDSQCFPATFKAYCELAPKSPDEIHTIRMIQRYERRPSCDLNVAFIRGLTIHNSGIKDLTPIGYLYNLERLDLKGNKVVDFSPLARLENLWSINVSDNPVSTLDDIFKIPEITRIKAKRTNITELPPGPYPVSLKFIQISNRIIYNRH